MRGSENQQERTASSQPQQQSNFLVNAPTIELPRGGGAIRGIGEKFTANPVTGTGAMSVPIPVSPGTPSHQNG